ncbi:hypothetical protein Q0A17_04215 [Citrobacter sp. S2-9]|uniref:DUF2190 family protein n=1 Tax=Citrobacter enshiensis TaxID=2971264 RepID=A0ABT8PRL5_9ENTR|nr:hypothetical protein [Citrobacter enshiensis]MDN8598627.1 hypothetical protein [Citrobacter enshiensis]
MTFQTRINQYLPIGVEGDFASDNPVSTWLAGEGALVAGDDGVTVGRFAWVDEDNLTASNTGTGVPQGFVSREGQALITDWMGNASMLIPAGMAVDLKTRGDFIVKTTTAATIGQKIFASLTDGTISTGAAGATIAGSVETIFTVGSAGAANEIIKMGTWGNSYA